MLSLGLDSTGLSGRSGFLREPKLSWRGCFRSERRHVNLTAKYNEYNDNSEGAKDRGGARNGYKEKNEAMLGLH